MEGVSILWSGHTKMAMKKSNVTIDSFLRNPTRQRKISALERGFMIVAVWGVLLHSVSARSFGNNLLKSSSCNRTNTDNICTTPACIHTASRILKNMNPTVDPCNNFYKFACGGFIDMAIIPDEKAEVSVLNNFDDQLLNQLKRSIDSPRLAESIRPFRLIKTIYNSCMNRSAIEEQGLTRLLSILKELGGWPVLEGDSWKDDDFSWISSIYKFRKTGFSIDYFIDLYISEDLRNSTKRIINLGEVKLGLSRDSLIKGLQDKDVEEYYQYMVDIAVILGVERDQAEKELMESLEFEINLANITLPKEKRRNVDLFNNPMTVAELSEKYPSIPWKEFINTMLKPHAEVDDDEIINVDVPSYISEFEKLINITPKRVQANYVMWRAVSSIAEYLNDRIRERQLKYLTIQKGLIKRESQPIECIISIAEKLPVAIGALYVRNYVSKDVKKNAVEMISDIQNQFKKILQNVDWMDEETIKRAIEKVAAIASHIGYPDELLDDSKLEEFYKKLQFDENSSYLENIMDVNLFNKEYSFSQLRKPVNKTHWVLYADVAIINARYYAFQNSMSFTAGILQDALFNIDRPKYLNYGGIGFVIGHEICHSFDDIGRKFDKDGNVVNWWASSTEEKYLEKVNCIIEQYGNYTVEEIKMKINGINTQGENIADIAGMKTSYLAYTEWAEKNKREPMLPGVPHTPKQIYWINAANTLCSVMRPEELKRRVSFGVHSPSEFRIRGSMSNLKEFSNDFNCPSDSPMNPQHKCVVW